MPECFKATHPIARVIIDCTKSFCEKPSSLAIQSRLFSYCTHHITYNSLAGIFTFVAVTFVSKLYDSFTSDIKIVKRCGILIEDSGVRMMTFGRYRIYNEKTVGAGFTLNISSFLAWKDQLSQEEVTESQTIAAMRIHVQRATQRIKYFRQIRHKIPLTMHGSINQIWTMSC